MSKTLKVMFSLVVAFVLVLGLSTTAFAGNNEAGNPSYDPSNNPSYTPTPTPVIYYPNYGQQEVAQPEAPAEAEPVPASPKTGDNGIVVLALVGAAVVATLGYAGVKALRA